VNQVQEAKIPTAMSSFLIEVRIKLFNLCETIPTSRYFCSSKKVFFLEIVLEFSYCSLKLRRQKTSLLKKKLQQKNTIDLRKKE
jgi:hypothetical protein